MNLKFWEWDLWPTRALREARRELANERLACGEMCERVESTQRQRDEERKKNVEALHALADMNARRGRLQSEIDHLKLQMQVAQMARQPLLPKPELLEALKSVTDRTPWWLAFHSLLNDQERTDLGEICVPKPLAELAHYNRGRLSAVADLRDALAQHRAEAQKVEAENTP